jgi:hypothetical protein
LSMARTNSRPMPDDAPLMTAMRILTPSFS